jgi:phage terminase Nu1 subunit (DNA packaging protein)
MNSEVLNSWKEIAAYLGRGVRTVQRWERELGLPVRRPRGRERSAVIALTPDLDRWLHKVPQGTLNCHPSNEGKREKLHLSTELLLKQTHLLFDRSQRMQEVVRNTLVLTAKLREQQSQRTRERLRLTEQRTILLSKTGELSSRAAGGGDA